MKIHSEPYLSNQLHSLFPSCRTIPHISSDIVQFLILNNYNCTILIFRYEQLEIMSLIVNDNVNVSN